MSRTLIISWSTDRVMTILLGTWRELRRKLCLHDDGDDMGGAWLAKGADWKKNRPNERITARHFFFAHKEKSTRLSISPDVAWDCNLSWWPEKQGIHYSDKGKSLSEMAVSLSAHWSNMQKKSLDHKPAPFLLMGFFFFFNSFSLEYSSTLKGIVQYTYVRERKVFYLVCR